MHSNSIHLHMHSNSKMPKHKKYLEFHKEIIEKTTVFVKTGKQNREILLRNYSYTLNTK